MLPLTEKNIRASLINASLSERRTLTLPPDYSILSWDDLDYLGWRDPKIPGIGYVIVELEQVPVGILLRQAKGAIRTRPQCSWCEDVQLLACAHFECSANVRKLPSVAYIGFDVQAARLHRIDALREHVRNFVRDVRDGS